MATLIKAATPILMTIVIGAVISGVALAGCGIWLVYLGSQGEATIQLLGQNIKTTMAGIPAIFIGGVIIAAVLRASLKTVVDIGGGEEPKE
jgi:hypothetical protein